MSVMAVGAAAEQIILELDINDTAVGDDVHAGVILRRQGPVYRNDCG